MTKVLIAPTEDYIKGARTVTENDVNAGSSVVLTVPNSNGFAVDGYVCVGVEGSERVELSKITAVTPTSITVDTLYISHKADEPVVAFRYNKRKFYGCTTVDGSYTEITADGSPKAISVTDPQGTVLEYTGLEGYSFFKSTYFNSTTSEESVIGDSEAKEADESLRYCSLYAIRKQAGFTNNPYITDGMVEIQRVRAESEVKSSVMAQYVLPLAEIPALIENITVLLAAGYMDYQEYGKEGAGVDWLNDARSQLKAIRAGTLRLLGSDETELPQNSQANQLQGFPDSVDNTNGPIRRHTMRQKF